MKKIDLKKLKEKPSFILLAVVGAIIVLLVILKLIDLVAGTTIITSPDAKLKIVKSEANKIELSSRKWYEN